MKFGKRIEMSDCYDKRSSDPKKNYGVGAMQVKMLLFGEKGTIQFVFATGIYPPQVMKEWEQKGHSIEPMGFDVGLHSPTPTYEGQEMMSENCPILSGPCYYDGSALAAESMFEILTSKGQDATWKEMERLYYNWTEK